MEIEITGVHYHVSDATKEHVEKKLAGFEKMQHLLERVQVTISPKNENGHENFEAHVHAKLAWHNAPLIDIKRSNHNLWAALDESFDSLSAALVKHKDKHNHVSHERMQVEDQDQ